ncbi:hypothetical protein BGZ63DRAFT_427451 [Mariannaea sp. PMI_226]|nr:hypothetical protein BGZ63DRAFT_427451 [Mariannaea sp. PMI_226]
MSAQNQDLALTQRRDDETMDSIVAASVVEPETESVPEDDSDWDEGDTLETWGDLVKAIVETTKKAFPASPKGDNFSEEAFKTYWHGVFSQLAKTIDSDADIPAFLTSPPEEEFTVALFAEKGACAFECPCCLPDVENNIVLKNVNGVTKGDLIKAFTEYMYGDTMPTVYSTKPFEKVQEPKSNEHDDVHVNEAYKKQALLLVYDSDWLIGAADKKTGKRTVVESVGPNAYMYCCEPEDFMEMATKKTSS